MNKPIIIALDFIHERDVLELVEKLDSNQCRLKVGKQLFTYHGPALVKKLIHKGFDVFLDLKFHDIPNTVAQACIAAADMGVWMVNVHAQGGQAMMAHTQNELEKLSSAPKLIAVTVLTSTSAEDLAILGHTETPAELALKYAAIAHQSGLDGVVCSAQEAAAMKAKFGQAFELVTPGIRPAGSDAGDQHRIVTPAQAIKNGSDYLVIGRPITKSDDPLASLLNISREINAVR